MAGAERYNAWLFDRARPYLGRSALDAGAGIGTFTALAAQDGRRVVAVEPDPRFADWLAHRFAAEPGVEVQREDVTELELADPVDSILCFNVLEHVPDDARAVQRFRDLLAPGGHLLLLVPAHARLFGAADRAVGHERRYGKRTLAGLLESNGFLVQDIRHVNPVGAIGWLVSSRLLRRTNIPGGPLAAYDRLVPLLRRLDRFDLAFGLSLWAVGRKPAQHRGSAGTAPEEEDGGARDDEREEVDGVECEGGRESL
jgi:SAM-dependent methyltransferase